MKLLINMNGLVVSGVFEDLIFDNSKSTKDLVPYSQEKINVICYVLPLLKCARKNPINLQSSRGNTAAIK